MFNFEYDVFEMIHDTCEENDMQDTYPICIRNVSLIHMKINICEIRILYVFRMYSWIRLSTGCVSRMYPWYVTDTYHTERIGYVSQIHIQYITVIRIQALHGLLILYTNDTYRWYILDTYLICIINFLCPLGTKSHCSWYNPTQWSIYGHPIDD